MDQKIYQLFKADRLESGIIRHNVQMYGEEKNFRYQCLRIGLVWPTMESPPYFVLGGMEVEDKFAPSLYGLVRIIQEFEPEDLSLDSLFEAVTDSYTSMLAEAIYVDQSQKDYYLRFWDFLDKRNLRSVNVHDIAYRDVIFRFTALKDFDRAGALMVDKGSLLYQDLQGLSKEHLRENPEIKFYRINALSYLISGLQKSPPLKPLKSETIRNRGHYGWM